MRVLDVTVDNITFEESIAKIEEFIKSKKSHHIITVNPEYIVRTQNDQKLRAIINNADLRVPDGIGLVKLAGLKERVTGIDLIWQLFKLGEDRGYTFALLGGSPTAAQTAASRIKLIHPRCEIVLVDELGQVTSNKKQVTEISKELKIKKPDILLVALGMGKQDIFIHELLTKVKIPVAIGVGGAFDMIAGITPRAPQWLQSIGLEWLWRLIIEPKRMSRIFTATIVFPLMFLFTKKAPRD